MSKVLMALVVAMIAFTSVHAIIVVKISSPTITLTTIIFALMFYTLMFLSGLAMMAGLSTRDG